MSDYECFTLTCTDGIGHIQFNRPQSLNSFIPSFWRELPHVAASLQHNEDVKVVVISSTGKHFTAGIDLSVLAGLANKQESDPSRYRHALKGLVTRLQKSLTALVDLPQPVIAAVQGGCVGAGLDLVCACDLRYGSEDAFFSLHEINLALVADLGTFPRLQKLVPEAIAREMAYLGERLPIARAERIGLVNGVYANQQDLLEGVMEIAAKIAAKSPLAISGSKQMLNFGLDHGTATTLDYLATWQAGMLSERDIAIAMQAQQTASQQKTSQQKTSDGEFPPLVTLDLSD